MDLAVGLEGDALGEEVVEAGREEALDAAAPFVGTVRLETEESVSIGGRDEKRVGKGALVKGGGGGGVGIQIYT